MALARSVVLICVSILGHSCKHRTKFIDEGLTNKFTNSTHMQIPSLRHLPGTICLTRSGPQLRISRQMWPRCGVDRRVLLPVSLDEVSPHVTVGVSLPVTSSTRLALWSHEVAFYHVWEPLAQLIAIEQAWSHPSSSILHTSGTPSKSLHSMHFQRGRFISDNSRLVPLSLVSRHVFTHVFTNKSG